MAWVAVPASQIACAFPFFPSSGSWIKQRLWYSQPQTNVNNIFKEDFIFIIGWWPIIYDGLQLPLCLFDLGPMSTILLPEEARGHST
jgi:hypothetical protein